MARKTSPTTNTTAAMICCRDGDTGPRLPTHGSTANTPPVLPGARSVSNKPRSSPCTPVSPRGQRSACGCAEDHPRVRKIDRQAAAAGQRARADDARDRSLRYFLGSTTGTRAMTAFGIRKPPMLHWRTNTGVTATRHTAPAPFSRGPAGASRSRAAAVESIIEVSAPVSITNRALWLSKPTCVVANTLPACRKTVIGVARPPVGAFPLRMRRRRAKSTVTVPKRESTSGAEQASEREP